MPYPYVYLVKVLPTLTVIERSFLTTHTPQMYSPPQPTHPLNTRLGVTVHMNSRNRSFGFQVAGGVDSYCIPQVEMVLPGKHTHTHTH